MGNDTQAWRAHIGMFNPRCKDTKPSNRVSNYPSHFPDSLLYHLLHLFTSISNASGSLIAYCCLLILLIVEITSSLLNKSLSSTKNPNKKIILQSLSNPSIVAFLSLLVRILLLRSGNVERNPGPQSNSFSIGCWNIDSLLARDGVKKNYIESIQNIHQFDLFGICETYLNQNTKSEEIVVEGFSPTPIRSDYCGPSSRPRGGVCLYYKDSTPIKHRPELEFPDETIVAEIKINKKKVIYILSYRSPSQSPTEFTKYTSDLAKTYNNALAENPYMIIITGDFNARSPVMMNKNKLLRGNVLLISVLKTSYSKSTMNQHICPMKQPRHASI